ncbi:MAG: cyclic nucleotide-binding domain-containing protein [Myxococcota bacterium]
MASVVLADRDVLLLCTDGIHDVLDEATLRDCLSLKTADQATDALCSAAREAGAEGDASAVVVQIAAEVSGEEIDALAQVLASTALFRDLTESERLLIAPYLDRVELDVGDVLFREGELGDAFYVIVDGRVRVSRGGTPLTEIGPGGGFGELCLAGPQIARSASVTAMSATVALGLTRDRFHEIVARRAAIGTRLLSRSLDLIGDRLRDLTERLSQVEKLAVGEMRPGDLALRTAIVLAARGEWPPPEPVAAPPPERVVPPPAGAVVVDDDEDDELEDPPTEAAPAARRGRRASRRGRPARRSDQPSAPPMPAPRQRRRLTPHAPARARAELPAPAPHAGRRAGAGGARRPAAARRADHGAARGDGRRGDGAGAAPTLEAPDSLDEVEAVLEPTEEDEDSEAEYTVAIGPRRPRRRPRYRSRRCGARCTGPTASRWTRPTSSSTWDDLGTDDGGDL